MTYAIAIDSSALDRLQAGFDFDVDWFTTWSEEPLPEGVSRVAIGQTIYLLGPKADADSHLLVIEIRERVCSATSKPSTNPRPSRVHS